MGESFEAFDSRDALMSAVGARMAEALARGLATRGKAAAALSGGSTPAPAYRALAQAELDWTRVTFALVDERFVPPSDPASNEGMARAALERALDAGAHFAPMWRNAPDAAAASALAERDYAGLAFDIAILGMGGDAHTASWFPHNASLAAALDPQNAKSVMALEAVQAQGAAQRLTLTYSALARADALILLITGEDKKARLEGARTQDVAEAPIRAVLDGLGGKLSIFWAP